MFTYHNTIEHAGLVDSEELARSLAEQFMKVRARNVQVNSTRVTFRGGVFRAVSNLNILTPFDTCELHIDPTSRHVSYRLSYKGLIVVASLMILLMTGFLASHEALREEMWAFPLIVWAWVVGGNLLVGIPRFRNFLKDSTDKAVRQLSTKTTSRTD